MPAFANSSFEILTDNDSVISIVQYFLTVPPGGNNARHATSIATNCDFKNRIVLDNSDMGMSFEKIDLINKRIKEYFDLQFPGRGIMYPTIGDKAEFNNLYFGLRNDSVMLVIEAYPTDHFSYGTYIIPIDKWKKH